MIGILSYRSIDLFIFFILKLDLNPIGNQAYLYSKINEKNVIKKGSKTFVSENVFQIHFLNFENYLNHCIF